MTENISFKNLNLNSLIQKAVDLEGYTIPTPIQAKSIPPLLEGKDLIGIAQTGTGKTAAFTLPILERMTENYPRRIRTLVLAPTRELAAQIGDSFATYGKFLKFKHTVIFGGVNQSKQVQALSRGVDILIATPGRLLDLMNQGKINLKDVEFFVLDEADRMLDMGFIHDIKKIIAKLPNKRQSLFFSATMSPAIDKLAKTLLKNPVKVEITAQATTVERINQNVFFVNTTEKEKLLLNLLKQKHLTSTLIFTRTKHRANKIALFLNKNNIYADAIHGNKSQNARTKAISDFKSGEIKVLVATDIAARGIDIDNISHVINFELPNEPESYVHRIGRTARAGTDGTAYSFCAAEERNFLRDIEALTRQTIPVMEHEFHSESAKHATGAAAKPLPKAKRGQSQKPQTRRPAGKRARTKEDSNSNKTSSKYSRPTSNNSSGSKAQSKKSSKNKSSSSKDSKPFFKRGPQGKKPARSRNSSKR